MYWVKRIFANTASNQTNSNHQRERMAATPDTMTVHVHLRPKPIVQESPLTIVEKECLEEIPEQWRSHPFDFGIDIFGDTEASVITAIKQGFDEIYKRSRNNNKPKNTVVITGQAPPSTWFNLGIKVAYLHGYSDINIYSGECHVDNVLRRVSNYPSLPQQLDEKSTRVIWVHADDLDVEKFKQQLNTSGENPDISTKVASNHQNTTEDNVVNVIHISYDREKLAVNDREHLDELFAKIHATAHSPDFVNSPNGGHVYVDKDAPPVLPFCLSACINKNKFTTISFYDNHDGDIYRYRETMYRKPE